MRPGDRRTKTIARECDAIGSGIACGTVVVRTFIVAVPTLQPLGTSRDRRGDAAVGRVHAYDAADDRRPSRLTVLVVLSGRGALRGQDR